ncbi:MAG: DUF6391 domain-containing protein [Bacillota bacterium]
MIFWFFLLVILFFFPVLLLPAALFFVMFIFLIPLKFTLNSLMSLLHAPGELYRIAKNPRLRKNHGLEHATINILEERYNYQGLAGYADENGFYIIGADDVFRVEVAAQEGRDRLIQGESELTIHERCGTTLTAANLISAVILIFLLFWTGYFTLWTILIAMLVANFTGPLLGDILQRNITTSAQVQNMKIIGADFTLSRRVFQPTQRIYVKTREV